MENLKDLLRNATYVILCMDIHILLREVDTLLQKIQSRKQNKSEKKARVMIRSQIYKSTLPHKITSARKEADYADNRHPEQPVQ